MLSIGYGKCNVDTRHHQNNFPSSAWETNLSLVSTLGHSHGVHCGMDIGKEIHILQKRKRKFFSKIVSSEKKNNTVFWKGCFFS